MLAGDYHESIWEGVPEGRLPPQFKARSTFLLEHCHAGEHVLDVGCGEGFFTEELQRAGLQTVGIDVAREPLRRAGRRSEALDLRLIPASEPWPFEDSSFDVVWAGEVIEHVADTASWLSELRRLLRSGGRLLLSTPAHGRLALLALAISSSSFERHFDPRSDHLRFYSAATLSSLLEDFGFEQIEIGGVGGIPGARRTLLAAATRSRF